MATITSPEENSWIVENLITPIGNSKVYPWLGGYQLEGYDNPSVGWVWITGEDWSWTNWKDGEPNDNPGYENCKNERYLKIYPSGNWNDDCRGASGWVTYVLIEYEPTAKAEEKPVIESFSWPSTIEIGEEAVFHYQVSDPNGDLYKVHLFISGVVGSGLFGDVDWDDLNGYDAEGVLKYTFTEAGIYSFWISVRDAHEHNDRSDEHSEWKDAKVVVTEVGPSGSLTVTVKNVEGNSLPSCAGTIEVVLFDASYEPLGKNVFKSYIGGGDSVQVEFANLADGDYLIEVYNTLNTGLMRREFWGAGYDVTVSGPTTKDFVRHTQWVSEVKINDESPYGKVIDVNAGEEVRLDVIVKNNEESSKNVKARLILDQDELSPYDFDETPRPVSIPNNGEKYFGYDFTPEKDGTYYFYIVVEGEYNKKYTEVDQHDWYNAFKVGVGTSVSILSITPSDTTPDPGETITLSVSTLNDGSAGTADIGMTVIDPSGEVCDIQWNEVEYTVGETKTLDFSYTLPYEAGRYDVISKSWDDCSGDCGSGQCCNPDNCRCIGEQKKLTEENVFNVEILVKGCVIIISGREIDPITGIPYYKTIYDYYSPAEIMFKSKTSGETYSTSAHEGQYKISVPAGEYTAYAKPINNDFVNPEPEDVVIKQNKYIDCPECNAMFGFIEFINLPIIFSSDNGFEEGKISLETIEEDYPEIYNWLEDEYELNGEIKIVGATLVFEGDYEKYRFKVADLVIDGIELVLLAKAVIVAFPAAVTVGGYLTLVGKEFVGAIPTEIIETVGKEIASGGWPDPSDVSTPDPEGNVYELFVTVLNSDIIETHLFYLDKHARWQHRYVQTHLYQLSDSNVVLQGKVVDDENNALNKVKLVATDVYGTILAGAETNPSGDYKLTFPLRAGVYEDEFLFGIVPVTQQHVKLILSKEGYKMPEEIDETFGVGVHDRDFTLEKDTENNVIKGKINIDLPDDYASRSIGFAVVPTITAVSEDGIVYSPYFKPDPWDGSYKFRIPKQHSKITLTTRIPGASFIGLECEEKSKDVNIGSAPTPITKEVHFYLDCQCIPYTPPEVQEWMLNSPGNLHIYDSEGRHVGINTTTGCVDTEIPYVAYSGTEAYPQIAGIFDLSSDLKIIVEGTEAGSFDLIGKKRSDEKKKIEFRQVLSSASTRAELNIGPTSNYIMRIDTNNDGQVDYEKEPDLINRYPVASFTSPENTIVNQTITFDASQSYDLDGGIVEYEWYFGEGYKVEGETAAMHTYLHPGRYPVMLTVMDDVGAIDISTKTITVSSKLNPIANFTIIPESSIVSQMITFNASNSTDPDGFIANYEWDFGDRSGRAGKVVTHSYSNPGSYSVTLTVEDDAGKIDTLTQVVEVTGEISSVDIPISSAENSQLRPTIAYNPANNEYLVTWDDKRSGSEREIYTQKVSGANSLVGSNFAIALSSGTDIEEVNPFVAYNPTANEYLVVWNEKSGYHNLYYVYAQRVSNTGSLLGDKITVSSGSVRVRKFFPTVAYNPANNEYLVVWYGQDVERQPYRIFGQRLSSSGSVLASNFAIGEDIGKDNYQYYPQVVYNSHSNDYLVVWADMRNGGKKDIYAQKVSGSGSLLGSNYCICNAANAQDAPSVAYNSADNQYLVTWQDCRTGSNADIYAQMISGAGNVLGNEIAVCVGRGTSLNPSVTYNSKSNVYFVAWEETDDIFAHEISNDGALSGSSVVISDAASYQKEPSVAYNSANNLYFVTWHDYRNGNYDIYGTSVQPSQQNNPPNKPSDPSPPDGSSAVSIDADLSWTDGDPDVGDTVTNDVYFGTSTSPPLVSNDQSGTTYDPGTLSKNTKYYWKIIATDNHGASTTGDLWEFNTCSGEEILKRKQITIDNTRNANTLTDYQVKLDVLYDPEMQPDFDDLRFTDSSDNSLNYWVEDYTPSAHATVWVKIPLIPGSGAATCYMDYGNPSASSQSNGDATFEFFDDFEDESIDTGKWTTSTTGFGAFVTENGGKINIHADAISNTTADLISQNSYGPDVAIMFRASISAGQWLDHKGLGFLSTNVGNDWDQVGDSVHWRGQDDDLYASNKYSDSSTNAFIEDGYFSGYRTWEIAWLSSEIRYYSNGILKATHTTNVPSVSITPRFSLKTYTTAPANPLDVFVDYVYVRKYADLEPTITTEGT